MMNSLHCDLGIREVESKGPIDLNIDKPWRDNPVLCIDDLILITPPCIYLIGINISGIHSAVEITLRIQNLSIPNPQIAKFDL